jgi:hypothetical protein
MANPRFDGEYELFLKSQDPLGGECHCKGTMRVEGNTAKASVKLDKSKQNSWYCMNKQFNFALETEILNENTVQFETVIHGQRLTTHAQFKDDLDQHRNRFQTSVLRHKVTGTTQKKTPTAQPSVKPSAL